MSKIEGTQKRYPEKMGAGELCISPGREGGLERE